MGGVEIAGRERAPYGIATPWKFLDGLRIPRIDSRRRSHKQTLWLGSHADKYRKSPIKRAPLWGLIAIVIVYPAGSCRSTAGRIPVKSHPGCASHLATIPGRQLAWLDALRRNPRPLDDYPRVQPTP